MPDESALLERGARFFVRKLCTEEGFFRRPAGRAPPWRIFASANSEKMVRVRMPRNARSLHLLLSGYGRNGVCSVALQDAADIFFDEDSQAFRRKSAITLWRGV
ncbi:MAG TPA: hypothetical protein VHE09_05315 [Rhizomicrobium sp.]|jgi:hypothetical protein|nr:hypothetical protein [Rhizomicrobium sp.]